MATLADMIDDVKGKLTGYTMRQDRITYVANASGITTSSTAIQVGSSDNLGKGIIEIDDELIWVDSFAKSTSTLNVIPGFGRGFQGTSAVSHAQYSKIIISPNYPRKDIKQAINDTILSTYPKLWAIASTTFTYTPTKNTYALPDDAQDVIAISYETIGPSKEWKKVTRWRMNPTSNISSFNSNNSITIDSGEIPAGRTIIVHYSMEPNILSSAAEDFASITGLPQSCQDVIILGATARMLSFIDPGRANLTSAESDALDTKVQYGSSTNSAKYIYALYQQRLNDEAAKLSNKYPPVIHYTR
jgi:hypothetical protein